MGSRKGKAVAGSKKSKKPAKTGMASKIGTPGGLNPLRINTYPTQFGGVMGRLHFLYYMLGLLGFMIVVGVAYGFGATTFVMMGIPIEVLAALGAGLGLAVTVISYSASFRRMRDIRGTVQNDTMWCVLTFLGMSVPLVNMVIIGMLYFYPGKITGGAGAANPFTQGAGRPQPTPNMQQRQSHRSVQPAPAGGQFDQEAHTAAFQGAAPSQGAGPVVPSRPAVAVEKLVANCPHCSMPCKVHVNGKYRCPSCGSPFTYANGEVGI